MFLLMTRVMKEKFVEAAHVSSSLFSCQMWCTVLGIPVVHLSSGTGPALQRCVLCVPLPFVSSAKRPTMGQRLVRERRRLWQKMTHSNPLLACHSLKVYRKCHVNTFSLLTVKESGRLKLLQLLFSSLGDLQIFSSHKIKSNALVTWHDMTWLVGILIILSIVG